MRDQLEKVLERWKAEAADCLKDSAIRNPVFRSRRRTLLECIGDLNTVLPGEKTMYPENEPMIHCYHYHVTGYYSDSAIFFRGDGYININGPISLTVLNKMSDEILARVKTKSSHFKPGAGQYFTIDSLSWMGSYPGKLDGNNGEKP